MRLRRRRSQGHATPEGCRGRDEAPQPRRADALRRRHSQPDDVMRVSRNVVRACLAGGIVAACLALTPVLAVAQSWLPEKGSASFSMVYSGTLNKKHYS